MEDVSEGAVPLYTLGYCLGMARDRSFGPAPVVLRPLETAQGRAEIIAGNENRTRRTESDYGIYLCAMPLKEICQTTPDLQAESVRVERI